MFCFLLNFTNKLNQQVEGIMSEEFKSRTLSMRVDGFFISRVIKVQKKYGFSTIVKALLFLADKGLKEFENESRTR